MNLSPHFTLEELTVTDHRTLDNTPGAEELGNLKRLALFLEQVKEALRFKPIIITSAYRQHRLGCAADIRVPGMTPDAVVRAVIASKIDYDQVIREFDSWTHISIPNTPETKPRKMALIIDKAGTRPF